MRVSSITTGLSVLVALLLGIAAGTGLFLETGGNPLSFFTLRGQTAQILGKGLYRYDTVFFGTGFRGQDAVILFLGVPLLILAIVLYQREFISGHLLLGGTLGYFLYVYASMVLGAAYNRLFLPLHCYLFCQPLRVYPGVHFS